MGIEGLLKPGAPDEKILLSLDQPGIEFASELPHTLWDVDEGPVFQLSRSRESLLVF